MGTYPKAKMQSSRSTNKNMEKIKSAIFRAVSLGGSNWSLPPMPLIDISTIMSMISMTTHSKIRRVMGKLWTMRPTFHLHFPFDALTDTSHCVRIQPAQWRYDVKSEGKITHLENPSTKAKSMLLVGQSSLSNLTKPFGVAIVFSSISVNDTTASQVSSASMAWLP